jgi:hypothetical protein
MYVCIHVSFIRENTNFLLFLCFVCICHCLAGACMCAWMATKACPRPLTCSLSAERLPVFRLCHLQESFVHTKSVYTHIVCIHACFTVAYFSYFALHMFLHTNILYILCIEPVQPTEHVCTLKRRCTRVC